MAKMVQAIIKKVKIIVTVPTENTKDIRNPTNILNNVLKIHLYVYGFVSKIKACLIVSKGPGKTIVFSSK